MKYNNNKKIKKNNKAQINKVFVYLMSIIVILFSSFLVIKFISSFSSDVDSRAESQIYNDFKPQFEKVYSTYGSEKVLEYIVSSKVKFVCFVSDKTKCDSTNTNGLSSTQIDSLKIVFDTGDNMALFTDSDLINSKNVGNIYSTENNGCFCIKPDTSNKFKVVLENRKNKVYVLNY